MSLIKNIKLINNFNKNKLLAVSCLNSSIRESHSSPKAKGTYEEHYKKSIESPEEYWASKIDLIDWYEKPKKILDRSKSPIEYWYCDGKLNAAYNCLDVHVNNGHGQQTALIHDSPSTGVIEKVSYKELLEQVSLFAGALSKHGVKKGERVLIYMPMIPQAVVAMLASGKYFEPFFDIQIILIRLFKARIGAIHSLVFGGFASKELATRINHAKPKVIVSANTGVEPGRLINYKELLDKAVELSDHKPAKCIFYNRKMFPEVNVKQSQDYYLNFTKEIENAKPHDCVPVDSNFPLYLLYTSGTTGLPKGVVRSTAGYLIALKNSMKEIYGVKPGETWWAFSDLGWTVGHSYGAYGPLAARNTSILYEGKPVGTPDPGAIFRVLSEHNAVSMFVAPTALRAIRQQDHHAEYAKNYSLEKLRYLFVAGEHCDHETMDWIKGVVKRPVFDHWWQTETGWPISSMCAGLMSKDELEHVPMGVSGKGVPGYNIKILNKDNNEVTKSKELGRIVIKLPLPPGTLNTLWENDDLFKSLYFEKFPGHYDTADIGFKTADGYISVLSRADDVINVAGHRLSCSAIEEAILEHHELAECAVVELNDSIKGCVPFAFLIRNQDSKSEEKDIINKVVALARESIGPVAAFRQAVVVNKLPKTRSGKIARNTLKAMINNKPFKIPVTIEDDSVYAQIKSVLLQNNYKNISDPDN